MVWATSKQRAASAGSVEPVVHLRDGHDEGVAGRDRVDGEERHHLVVPPHEPAGDLALDDLGEERRHRARIVG
jgi:hypothetical protein